MFGTPSGFVAIFVLFFVGCHSVDTVKYTSRKYPQTKSIEIYSSAGLVVEPYIELGYIEAGGGLGVSNATLMEDMKAKAMKEGANALVAVDFGATMHYSNATGSFSKPWSKALMIRYKKNITSSAATAENKKLVEIKSGEILKPFGDNTSISFSFDAQRRPTIILSDGEISKSSTAATSPASLHGFGPGEYLYVTLTGGDKIRVMVESIVKDLLILSY